jgi:hypothetical protein
MVEWDFQSPDIVYGRAEYEWVDWPPEGETDTIVVLRLQGARRLLPLRVHARRDHLSRVMNQTYYVWRCTLPYKSEDRRCDYFPGHEDMPPLPGQRCYNCGGVRAEVIHVVRNLVAARTDRRSGR